MVERIEWRNGPFTVELVPSRGGTQSRLAWTAPHGQTHELLRRTTAAEIEDLSRSTSAFSNFVMAPFANRIDGAAFRYDGELFTLPMNRPEQNCAIHGHAREIPWTIETNTPEKTVLEVEFARSDTPYAFTCRVGFSVSDDSLVQSLWVRNDGETTLPFGFGLHPWFPMDEHTELEFSADVAFETDGRTFPLDLADVEGNLDFSSPAKVNPRAELDRPFAGWTSRKATIYQPTAGYALDILGRGALTNVHVFIPDGGDAFCVEPTSHVTDVVNRRNFAAYGDMTPLDPGQSLKGDMVLKPRLWTPV